VDIHETENGMILVADVPGVDESGLDLRVEKQVLRIEGRPVPLAEGVRVHVDEIGRGGFRRSFRLSEDLDASAIDATIRDGVLRVEIPKSERLKPRTIEIRSS
jgi:HSP20 family molecular chaperone IbpA